MAKNLRKFAAVDVDRDGKTRRTEGSIVGDHVVRDRNGKTRGRSDPLLDTAIRDEELQSSESETWKSQWPKGSRGNEDYNLNLGLVSCAAAFLRERFSYKRINLGGCWGVT